MRIIASKSKDTPEGCVDITIEPMGCMILTPPDQYALDFEGGGVVNNLHVWNWKINQAIANHNKYSFRWKLKITLKALRNIWLNHWYVK